MTKETEIINDMIGNETTVIQNLEDGVPVDLSQVGYYGLIMACKRTKGNNFSVSWGLENELLVDGGTSNLLNQADGVLNSDVKDKMDIALKDPTRGSNVFIKIVDKLWSKANF